MTRFGGVVFALAAVPLMAGAQSVPLGALRFDTEPLWAYGFAAPPEPGDRAAPQTPPSRTLRTDESVAEQVRPRRLAGSSASYSLVDIRDGQNVVDWFPREHPPMPAVIAHGPERLASLRRGCAACHLPNGQGRPENASPAGLPLAYIIRQLEDFRAGLRYSADPRKPNTPTMIALAKAMTGGELQTAAEYFAALRYRAWVRVIETALVPKTRLVGNLFLPVASTPDEPIAGRIIEVPENEQQSETYRNPHSGFIAYVPPGSIAKGRAIVTTGALLHRGEVERDGGRVTLVRTTPCVTCHGPQLLGVGDVPPIAGRSPSYLVRQLWDFQQGTRRGASSSLMKPIVASLNTADLVDIAAYVASLPVF